MQILAQCDVTGSGAVNDGACWQVQLTQCGIDPCDTTLLPPYGAPGSLGYSPGGRALL